MSDFVQSLEPRRLMYFGAIVKGFGTGGSSTAPTIGGSDSLHANAITVSGGKTLVAVGGGLARFDADGTLDTTFGTSGITGFRGVSFVDDGVDSAGRVYVLATGTSGTLVQRYTAASRLDSSFGTNGTALVESSGTFIPAAIAVASDGRVVVAGGLGGSTGTTTRLYELSVAATRESNFGDHGVVDLKLGYDDLVSPDTGDHVVDLGFDVAGRLRILGSSYNADTQSDDGNSFVAVAMLNIDGSVSSVSRQATFDGEQLIASSGVIRSDGSAVIATTNNAGRIAFVGFFPSGKSAFRTYAAASTGTGGTDDAAALGDNRVAFVNSMGRTFFVTAAGEVSNVVQPVAADYYGTDAVAATSDGDLVIADVASPYVRLTKFDAGKASDPRPDDLPAAAVIDTAVDTSGGLHVAYFDVASKSLKYAYRNAQGYWGGIKTVDATAGAGAAISIDTITLKGKTYVGIGYYDATNGDLRLAVSSTFGKKFGITTVASRGNVGLSPTFHFTDDGGYALTYTDKTTGTLYYSLNTGKGFTTEAIDTNVGDYSEFVYDPSTRRPAIAYAKQDDTVWYAFKGKGTTWADARVRVATTAAGAAFVHLAIPQDVADDGGPKISYYDLAGADLVLATYNRYADAGTHWSKQTIASKGVVGSYGAITGPGYDATLYAWNKSSDTAYEYDISRTYGTATLVPIATGGGQYLSVATDDYGTVYAYAYKDTASGLTFVR